MNAPYPTISISLTLDRLNGRDVLSAVLHAILFHRLFGCVKPQTFDVLDVTMPGVADAEMAELVKERVNEFWKAVEGEPTKQGQVLVVFSEKRQRKSSWFSVYAGEEEVPWEQWTITATLTPVPPRQKAAADLALAAVLRQTLLTILTHTASEQGRAAVPLITRADVISPFPFKIAVKVAGAEVN